MNWALWSGDEPKGRTGARRAQGAIIAEGLEYQSPAEDSCGYGSESLQHLL